MTTTDRHADISQSDLARLTRFQEAHRRLDQGLIRPEQTSMTPERSLERWQARLAEMASFLSECGDPQKHFKAIHVTGTSGKGSVTTLIGKALELAGYRVGVHTSPYLQSPTEKNSINSQLLSAEEFVDLVDWVYPIALPRKTPENPASIHGMASVAIAFEAFRRQEVDVAVIEAGCGGRFDLTNFVEPIAAVITNVGPDHILSLGPTVDDIAWHKAGIIKPGAKAITGALGGPLEVIRQEAKQLGVALQEVAPDMERPFWEINAAVAETCLDTLALELTIPAKIWEEAKIAAKLPARREVLQLGSQQVILDGAHNPDKIAALARTLEPGAVFVTGCLAAKDHSRLVGSIAPLADAVITAEPEVYLKPPTPAKELAHAFVDAGVRAEAATDALRALDRALELAGDERQVVVTGSLYLVGQIRERWFPTEQIILQQTCWPE